MAHPWANVFILIVGGISLASGFLGLLGGSPEWAPTLHVHRISGYALVALLLWKGRNIITPLMSVRRWRRSPALHLGGLALLALLLTPLTLGLVWSFGGFFAYLGFSGLSWHIYLSLLLAPFVVWHAQRHSVDAAHAVLGRPAFISPAGGSWPCRVCSVAGRQAGVRRLRATGVAKAVHGVVRARELCREPLPDNILAKRQPLTGRQGGLEIEGHGAGRP